MVIKNSLTEEQSKALKKVKEILKEILDPTRHDDEYILRFLVARKFNVDASVAMLEKHIKTFQEFGYDKVLTNYTPSEKLDYFVSAVLGFDNEGSIVRLVSVCDHIGLSMSYSKQECLRDSAYLMESDLQEQKKNGKGTKITYITDLTTVTWKLLLCKQWARNFAAILRFYEANYPETLKMGFYINAPPSFEYFFTFLGKYLPQDILTKLKILSADQVKPVLTSIMNPDILPAYMGGTRTDPDGDINCYSMFKIKPGTPVPIKFYTDTQVDNLDQDPDAKKVTIKKKSQFVLTFLVDTPGTIISWSFKTASNDIGIGVNFKKLGQSENVVLIPIHRVDSHKFVETGKIECTDVGTYELIFSNLYSVMTKKVLTYKTNIQKPGEITKNCKPQTTTTIVKGSKKKV